MEKTRQHFDGALGDKSPFPCTIPRVLFPFPKSILQRLRRKYTPHQACLIAYLYYRTYYKDDWKFHAADIASQIEGMTHDRAYKLCIAFVKKGILRDKGTKRIDYPKPLPNGQTYYKVREFSSDFETAYRLIFIKSGATTIFEGNLKEYTGDKTPAPRVPPEPVKSSGVIIKADLGDYLKEIENTLFNPKPNQERKDNERNQPNRDTTKENCQAVRLYAKRRTDRAYLVQEPRTLLSRRKRINPSELSGVNIKRCLPTAPKPTDQDKADAREFQRIWDEIE